MYAYIRKGCLIRLGFHNGSAQNTESKLHCVCIKENQNNSLQSFFRTHIKSEVTLSLFVLIKDDQSNLSIFSEKSEFHF